MAQIQTSNDGIEVIRDILIDVQLLQFYNRVKDELQVGFIAINNLKSYSNVYVY